MKTNKESKHIYKIAFLVSISCVLQIAESLIPHPIPGLRLGLSNVITLIALVTMGFGYALEITILRTLLSSFIVGTFMSPTFVLSFSAGLMSTVSMGFFYWLGRRQRYLRLSIVGISIVGALTHNIMQLYLAYFLLIKHPGVFIFFPWLCIGAVVMGLVTGVSSASVCLRLKEKGSQELFAGYLCANSPSLLFRQYLPGDSFIHHLRPQVKIATIFILSVAVLIFNSVWLYSGLCIFLLLAMIISKTSFSFVFQGLRRYSSMIVVAFLFPLLFNQGKHILSPIAYFNITAEGLAAGSAFAWRLSFLISASLLLARTTSPKELGHGVAHMLYPFRAFGISQERTAAILSLSWMGVPVLWEIAKNNLRSIDFKNAKTFRNLLPILCDFIVIFYLQTEQIAMLWEEEHLRSQVST